VLTRRREDFRFLDVVIRAARRNLPAPFGSNAVVFGGRTGAPPIVRRLKLIESKAVRTRIARLELSPSRRRGMVIGDARLFKRLCRSASKCLVPRKSAGFQFLVIK
jgi:hypothetical protein